MTVLSSSKVRPADMLIRVLCLTSILTTGHRTETTMTIAHSAETTSDTSEITLTAVAIGDHHQHSARKSDSGDDHQQNEYDRGDDHQHNEHHSGDHCQPNGHDSDTHLQHNGRDNGDQHGEQDSGDYDQHNVRDHHQHNERDSASGDHHRRNGRDAGSRDYNQHNGLDASRSDHHQRNGCKAHSGEHHQHDERETDHGNHHQHNGRETDHGNHHQHNGRETDHGNHHQHNGRETDHGNHHQHNGQETDHGNHHQHNGRETDHGNHHQHNGRETDHGNHHQHNGRETDHGNHHQHNGRDASSDQQQHSVSNESAAVDGPASPSSFPRYTKGRHCAHAAPVAENKPLPSARRAIRDTGDLGWLINRSNDIYDGFHSVSSNNFANTTITSHTLTSINVVTSSGLTSDSTVIPSRLTSNSTISSSHFTAHANLRSYTVNEKMKTNLGSVLDSQSHADTFRTVTTKRTRSLSQHVTEQAHSFSQEDTKSLSRFYANIETRADGFENTNHTDWGHFLQKNAASSSSTGPGSAWAVNSFSDGVTHLAAADSVPGDEVTANITHMNKHTHGDNGYVFVGDSSFGNKLFHSMFGKGFMSQLKSIIRMLKASLSTSFTDSEASINETFTEVESLYGSVWGESGVETHSTTINGTMKTAHNISSLHPSETQRPDVYVNSSFVLHCLAQELDKVRLPAGDGEMVLNMTKEHSDQLCCHRRCLMMMKLPSHTRLRFHITPDVRSLPQAVSFDVSERKYYADTLQTVSRLVFPKFHGWDGKTFSNPGVVMTFEWTVGNMTGQSAFLRIKFVLVPKSALPNLEMVFTRSIKNTPGSDGTKMFMYCPQIMWARLDMPHTQYFMISFPSIDMGFGSMCMGSSLTLYRDTQMETLAKYCSYYEPDPFITRAKTIFIRFEAFMTMAPLKGFRMLFSFHGRALRRLSSGWNCSVSFWEDVRQHFPCNLYRDCLDGRDEAACPYRNNSCRQGHFQIGDLCYVYVSAKGTNTTWAWNDAFLHCRTMGADLISLSDQQMLKELIELVYTYRPMATFYAGLHTVADSFPPIYHRGWQTIKGVIIYGWPMITHLAYERPSCCSIGVFGDLVPTMVDSSCQVPVTNDAICEMPESPEHEGGTARNQSAVLTMSALVPLSQGLWHLNVSQFVTCPQGHVTHRSLACDQQSACWWQGTSSCAAPLRPAPPGFVCANGLQIVPYTVLCDWRADCSDSSDENFCHHLPCQHFQLECDNGQCVKLDMICDRAQDCVDGSDEEQCTSPMMRWPNLNASEINVVRFHHGGRITYTALEQKDSDAITCPDNHFMCTDTRYCLPIFVRCNGIHDCPLGQDEANCNTHTCPGLYRCRASTVCVRSEDLCDRIHHCPQRDDELLCDFVCPPQCVCYGLALFCSRPFQMARYKQTRFLNADSSGLQLEDVAHNTMLIHLSLASCNLKEVIRMDLPNLHSLDLRDNEITSITHDHLSLLPHLTSLSIANNPLSGLFRENATSPTSSYHLLTLDISHISLTHLDLNPFTSFPSLQVLNLTHCGVDSLSPRGFQDLIYLHTLDLRGCPLTYFTADIFKGVHGLQSVFADNYKLCCPSTLPSGFNPVNCMAPWNEISSCDNLLRSDIYRGFLVCLAGLALLGNLVTFVCRAFLGKIRNSFDVFVVTLCVSDFLMGIFLSIIGIADRLYIGTYLWQDVSWRNSATCKTAGVLSVLSSEASALIVCFITLDRFLVIRFPFSEVRFQKNSALLVSGLVMGLSLVLAIVPLLPPTSHWEFYSQNSICIPLPITSQEFAGHDYSYSLLVIFNLVLFVFTAMGQLSIYWSVQLQQHSIRSRCNKTNNDVKLARRLFTIVLSDFLCWFPIGLLGILASTGISIPSEVNVAIAVFVLPLNSAINPFLYTINTLMEKRQQKKEERMKMFLVAQMRQQSVMS